MLYQIPAHGRLAVGIAAGRGSLLALSSPDGERPSNGRICPRLKSSAKLSTHFNQYHNGTRAVSMHVTIMASQTSLRSRLPGADPREAAIGWKALHGTGNQFNCQGVRQPSAKARSLFGESPERVLSLTDRWVFMLKVIISDDSATSNRDTKLPYGACAF
jgi:hypothetical protein